MTGSNRILIVGDSYMGADLFIPALERHGLADDADAVTITPTEQPEWSVDGIREYEGDPAEISRLITDHEVLALHGAPVTRRLLDAHPQLRLIACARGGPVNIDVAAARERGVVVTTTPGKNADAVADLTVGFIVSLLRNVRPSIDAVRDAAASGTPIAQSAFEGARWFGHELRGRRLGLVGLGHVARLVASRVRTLGMEVWAFDPFVQARTVDGVIQVDSLFELLAQVEVLSLHARATEENRHMMGARELSTLPAGAYFVNTARESLVDERALVEALRVGHLRGVALDVCEPGGPWPDLAADPRVILTPHIGGATFETLQRGADMLAREIAAFLTGRDLRWTV